MVVSSSLASYPIIGLFEGEGGGEGSEAVAAAAALVDAPPPW